MVHANWAPYLFFSPYSVSFGSQPDKGLVQLLVLVSGRSGGSVGSVGSVGSGSSLGVGSGVVREVMVWVPAIHWLLSRFSYHLCYWGCHLGLFSSPAHLYNLHIVCLCGYASREYPGKKATSSRTSSTT